jgi:hypothetical protein
VGADLVSTGRYSSDRPDIDRFKEIRSVSFGPRSRYHQVCVFLVRDETPIPQCPSRGLNGRRQLLHGPDRFQALEHAPSCPLLRC